VFLVLLIHLYKPLKRPLTEDLISKYFAGLSFQNIYTKRYNRGVLLIGRKISFKKEHALTKAMYLFWKKVMMLHIY